MRELALFPVFLPSENGNRRVARGSDEWPKALVTCRIGCVRAGQESPFCQLAKVGVAGSSVRSAYGPNNPWFRRAKASGAGRIRAGCLERDVVFAEPALGVHGAIDAAYHAKYDRYGPGIVGTVVGPEVEAVTSKLVPRSTSASYQFNDEIVANN